MAGTKTEVTQKKQQSVKKEKTGSLVHIRNTEKKKESKKAGKIGTLGDIVFTVSEKKVKTFNNLQIESAASYEKHTRHIKKPLLEFQYNDTDKASLDIYISVFLGVSPLAMIKKIDEYKKTGKVLSLVIGGKKYGKKWVITSFSKKYKTFDNKGSLLIAECSISLEEYADR